MSPAQAQPYAARRAFHTMAPDRVLSGAGTRHEVARLVDRMGARRALIATSESVYTKTPLAAELEASLGAAGVGVFSGCSQHAPQPAVDALAAQTDETEADVVIALGGSSVSDAVKAAVLQCASGRAPTDRIIPQVAIPTTLSGGEFTAGAGITDAAHTKQLVTDSRVMPKIVVLDPEATVYTPEELWLSSGIKAIEHAVEAVWCLRPHPVVDTLALESIRLMATHLAPSRDRGAIDARAACQMAMWMSLAGTSTAGIRLSHLIGHQVGSRWDIAHGLTACVLLPTVMRYLAPATLPAQVRIAEALGVTPVAGRDAEAVAREGADRLEQLIRDLGLPTGIGSVGGCADDIDQVAEAGYEAARALKLTGDLPEGSQSVRRLLEMAW